MSSAPRRRGPYAKTAARRAAIASAAHDLVLESGHRALTTAAVATRAGISERTMLYHFPTRDHLLVAALDWAESSTGTLLDRDRDRVLAGGLRGLPRLSLGERGSPQIMHLYSAMSAAADHPGHPAHAFFRAHAERTLAAFAEFVEREQRAGAVDVEIDPARLARQLYAVWSGLQGLWVLDETIDLVADLEDAVARLVSSAAAASRAV